MKALIVVDVQNDFCEGGALPVNGGHLIAERIASMPIWADFHLHFATLDWHADGTSNGGHFNEWPEHCVAYSTGAAFASPLSEGMFESVFLKGYGAASYSGFDGREWSDRRRSLGEMLPHYNVNEVAICGLALDYCVKATALDAVKSGYKTRVLLDYTAAVDVTTQAQALNEMTAAGIILE